MKNMVIRKNFRKNIVICTSFMAKLTQKEYFFPNASLGLYLDLIHYFAKDSAINNEDHGFFFNFHLKGKYVFFSRLDVVKGYYQVPVINASREKTAVLLLLGPTLWGLRFCFCLPGRYLTSLRTKESTVHICESFKRRQRTGLAINSSRV